MSRLSLLFGFTLLLPTTAFAQDVVVQEADAFQVNPAVATPSVSPRPVPPGARAGQPVPPGVKPGQATPTKPPTGKDGKKTGKAKTTAPPIVITRGTEPPEDLKASEAILRHEPDERVAFSFVGAKWLKVLQTVATASNMTLDWQELPGDYLNLVTRRSYKIEEARDIINRHLLARGYTMLTEGETLRVIKLDKLNTASVPRVSPDDLDKRLDHEFVKVSFRLNWLIAEEAVAELSSMKSKHGKMVHLTATNRIEAIDTVMNLKDIRDLLNTEQSDEGQEKLLKNIPLVHRRASEVIEMIREFMGVERKNAPKSSSSSSGGSMQMMQQMQRQMQQQMQQMAKAGAKGKSKAPEEISLVLNQRENSILVKAPPNKMAQIEQAIAALDVVSESANSLLGNLNKYKTYQLESFDAQPLVDMLNELGDLAPQTQLRVDKDKNMIIAYASLADHLTITSLVEKLDEKRRHFEVLQLRRLEADFVAGTIRFLMGEDGEEETSQSSRYSFYGWGGYGSSNKKDDKSNEFRVDADVGNNRLLLFASELELQQIEDLLVKLGEIPEKDSRESRRRLIDVDPNTNPEEFLKRIRQLWPKENELNIQPVPEELQKAREAEELKKAKEKAKNQPDEDGEPDPGPPTKPTVTQAIGPAALFSLAQTEPTDPTKPTDDPTDPAEVAAPSNPTQPAAPPKSELTPEQKALQEIFGRQRKQIPSVDREPPPVNIGFTPSGRLMITSEDPGALDDMEEILMPFTQTRCKYVIFTLKYASPGWTASTLREFFKDPNNQEPMLDWWGEVRNQNKGGKGRLSDRPEPRFIADSYSSTILVQGADPRQLKTIKELIELYDMPEPSDSRSVRVTEMFPIKYSKAKVIGEAIKEVYRDLLSANDKALQKDDKGSVDRSVTYIRGSGSDNDDEETEIRFKGLLSVGVDEISNTLIISASSGLLDNIRVMVTKLDAAAMPSSTVKVLQLNTSLSPNFLKSRLTEILGPTKVKTSKTGQKQPQPNQPKPNTAAAEAASE